jgi:hypothetical protein
MTTTILARRGGDDACQQTGAAGVFCLRRSKPRL